MKLKSIVPVLVAVVLLGVLMWATAPIIEDLDDPVAKAKSDIRTIETVLTLYQLDNMRYPTTQQGLKALVQRPDDPNVKTWRKGGYLARIPKDPWGRGYYYASPGQYGEIDIFTLGRDGRVGGNLSN